jgi:hypothetical protein
VLLVDEREFEVVVKLPFAVSAEKAAKVLRAWWAAKEKRRLDMRRRRAKNPEYGRGSGL